jgi:hypothetical protein
VRDISLELDRYQELPTDIRTKVYEFFDLAIAIFTQTDPEAAEFSHMKKSQEQVFHAVYYYIKNTLLDAVSK